MKKIKKNQIKQIKRKEDFMHCEINKALYDAFPLNDKSDVFSGYLYMKYYEYVIAEMTRVVGLSCREPTPKLDPGIAEMIELLVQQIIETGASRETSTHHAKVLTLQDVLKLVTQKEDLHLVPSERVIPFKIARDVILESPGTIAVGSCPCRMISEKPCLPPPMEVCLWPGEPNASFIAKQNPNFRNISQDEAVAILEECHKKGFVHTAYFEKGASNRMDVICNCCDCCCIGLKMFNMLDMDDQNPFIAPSGYVAEIDDTCNGCGECAESTCHFNAISMDEDNQKAVVKFEKCMGCGVCENVCPTEAIRMRKEPSKGDPLDIDEMKRE